MKVVINTCLGGFGLSPEAWNALEAAGLPHDGSRYAVVEDMYSPGFRSDPRLVKVVEDMGEAAWGGFSKLKVIDIPDGVKWHIGEDKGVEWVEEDHRTWGEDA